MTTVVKMINGYNQLGRLLKLDPQKNEILSQDGQWCSNKMRHPMLPN